MKRKTATEIESQTTKRSVKRLSHQPDYNTRSNAARLDNKSQTDWVNTEQNRNSYHTPMPFALLTRNDESGKIALMETTRSGSVKDILNVLQYCPTQHRYDLLAQQDNRGRTALMTAVQSGNVEVAQTLLEACPTQRLFDLLALQDIRGQTALMLTAVRSRERSDGQFVEDTNRLYVDHTTTPEIPQWHDEGIDKEHQRQIDTLKLLMKSCPAVKLFDLLSTQDSQGHTVLMLAAMRKYPTRYVPDMRTAYLKIMTNLEDLNESTPANTQLNEMGIKFIHNLLLLCPEPQRFDLMRIQDLQGKSALLLALESANLAAAIVIRHHCPVHQRFQLVYLEDQSGKTAFWEANIEDAHHEDGLLRSFLWGFSHTWKEKFLMMKTMARVRVVNIQSNRPKYN
jgi:ankyrin repeat protein